MGAPPPSLPATLPGFVQPELRRQPLIRDIGLVRDFGGALVDGRLMEDVRQRLTAAEPV